MHLISAALVPDNKATTPARAGTVDMDVVPEAKTAVLCYNVRGVGRSGGKQAWVGAGEGDYAALERWGVGVTGVRDIWRFVSRVPSSLFIQSRSRNSREGRGQRAVGNLSSTSVEIDPTRPDLT